MAKHRIRRWFQFGVLDLLIVTTIVAVAAVLWRPAQLHELVAAGATPGQQWSDNNLRMKFCWCPPGEFNMGEPPNQVDVRLSRGFWMGKYEVRQAEYRQVMNENPSHFSHEDMAEAASVRRDAEKRPVENVTWHEAVEFCRALSDAERRAGRLSTAWEYRLPTEAQWEYACRAGTQTRYSFGNDYSRLGDFAWYDDNSLGTHEVGRKQANAWGLHDMHGNAWEWCSDWYQHPVVGGTDSEVNVPAYGRVLRGGGWYCVGPCCESAHRFLGTPEARDNSVGFRVAIVQSR